MFRRLVVACCGSLLMSACAHGIATRPAARAGSFAFVEAIRDYVRPRDVPAPFQHLVDWHAGTQPVVLLFTAGGQRACAITSPEAARVVVYKRYRCQWSAAR